MVVPGSLSPDESNSRVHNLLEEKIYVLSLEKATITLKLHFNYDDNLKIIQKILVPRDLICHQDLYFAIYQIIEKNSLKLTNKLSLEWEKNELSTRINNHLEHLNSPDPQNPRLTNLNEKINKIKNKLFLEIKIIDKIDENNPIKLPYIFFVKEETILEKLYLNIIHWDYRELASKPISDIILELNHPRVFFINNPETTFEKLGYHRRDKPEVTLDLSGISLVTSRENDTIQTENYQRFEPKGLVNNDDDSQLRKLLVEERSFEGFNGENSELSFNKTPWPPEYPTAMESFSTNYEEIKKSCLTEDGYVDWDKVGQTTNEKSYQSPQDNAIELIDNNEPSKSDRSNDYKNPEIKNETTTKYVGLINQAMTCYLNSLLQALYMTPEFRNALYNWEFIESQDRDEATSIPYQLQKLFLNLQTSDKTAIETTSLTKSFGWDSAEAWHQHDVQELCRVMFDALEQKFKNTEQADLINRLYEGKMIDYVKCLECQTEKSREDTFLDIPLPVRPFGSNIAYDNIQEALRAFVQPETLDGVNQYFCETCNKKCDAHKGLKFTKFPYLLTLHLKRFDFDYNTLQRIKLNDKVSFPNVLNLNSFITSEDDVNESLSSPTTDEDVGVKCDDSSTTDSVVWDEFLPPIKNGFSSSVPIATASSSLSPTTGDNHEQDDDEGIDMSNGPSTSSTNSQENDKYCTKSGPYQYELFSILIHSGSASGGHYYAYIKDFKENHWICFNDQNLSSVTSNDIQRTFGGGQTRTYYSGYYSSSTNAYMLMYRQIDDKRNCLPMTVENFPPHIKELLVKIKNNDDDDVNRKQRLLRDVKPMTKIRISVLHPVERVYKSKKVYCFDGNDEKLQDYVYKMYKDFSLEMIVDVEQCRLVYWDPINEFVQWSYDNKENDKIIDLLDNSKDEYTDCHELLLEIRDKNSEFKRYLPGGCKISIYQVDLIKKEFIDGPFITRGLLSQTICEFKKQLADEFCTNYDNILCCIVKCSVPIIMLDNNDDAELRNQGFLGGCNNKVFLTTRDTVKQLNYTSTDIQNIFLKLSDDLDNIIRLTINLPDMSKEILEEMNISLLDDDKKLIIDDDDDDIDGVDPLSRIKKRAIDDDSGFCSGNSSNKDDDKNKESPTISTLESEECQEQTSNSEDSSQSDSDRTLVGDTSEEDYDYRYSLFLSSQNEQNDDKKFCKIIKRKNNDNVYLNILVDKKMTLETFTFKIEQYIGISKNCFKLIPLTNDDITDIDCKNLNTKFNLYNDNTIIDIKLNRILGINEIKIQLYQLNLNSKTMESALTFLFDLIVLKDTTIEQLKNIIQRDMKVKLNTDIKIDRMRLRKKIYELPSKKIFNEQRINDFVSPSQAEIPNFSLQFILQQLDYDDPVVDDKQVIIIVKLYTGLADDNQLYQEVVLSSASSTMEELRDKVSELSGVPGDCLMFSKGKWPAERQGRIVWILPDDKKPQFLDGDVYFYKNTSEKQKEDLNKTEWEAPDERDRRLLKDNRTPAVSTYQRRRERALKIYVDDK